MGPLSTSTTSRTPRRVRWKAVLAPVTPPPMMTTSAVRVVMRAMLRNGARRRNAGVACGPPSATRCPEGTIPRGGPRMSVSIRQIHPVFVGEVSGVDVARPLSPDDVAALEAGMDRYAVLVFHEQKLTDEQQMAFSVN